MTSQASLSRDEDGDDSSSTYSLYSFHRDDFSTDNVDDADDDDDDNVGDDDALGDFNQSDQFFRRGKRQIGSAARNNDGTGDSLHDPAKFTSKPWGGNGKTNQLSSSCNNPTDQVFISPQGSPRNSFIENSSWLIQHTNSFISMRKPSVIYPGRLARSPDAHVVQHALVNAHGGQSSSMLDAQQALITRARKAIDKEETDMRLDEERNKSKQAKKPDSIDSIPLVQDSLNSSRNASKVTITENVKEERRKVWERMDGGYKSREESGTNASVTYREAQKSVHFDEELISKLRMGAVSRNDSRGPAPVDNVIQTRSILIGGGVEVKDPWKDGGMNGVIVDRTDWSRMRMRKDTDGLMYSDAELGRRRLDVVEKRASVGAREVRKSEGVKARVWKGVPRMPIFGGVHTVRGKDGKKESGAQRGQSSARKVNRNSSATTAAVERMTNTAAAVAAESNQLLACVTGCRYASVHRMCRKYGFRPVREEMGWNLNWTDGCLSLAQMMNMKKFQKINHFPGMVQICRKDTLANALNRMLKLFPQEYNVFPRTWNLPTDYGEFASFARHHKNAVYILKPESGCQGRGIWMTRNYKDIGEMDDWICQQYICNPLLIDGFKFDIRFYVCVTSVDPLRVYVYKEGLARFCTVPYCKPNNNNIDDAYMHLTNYSINKTSEDFIAEDGGSKRRLTTVFKWLEYKGHDVQKLLQNIDDLIIKTLLPIGTALKQNYTSLFHRHDQGSACFELLGFDILVDANLRPYLLEVNHSPSFHTDQKLDCEIKEPLILDTLNLVNFHSVNRVQCLKNERASIIERLNARPPRVLLNLPTRPRKRPSNTRATRPGSTQAPRADIQVTSPEGAIMPARSASKRTPQGDQATPEGAAMPVAIAAKGTRTGGHAIPEGATVPASSTARVTRQGETKQREMEVKQEGAGLTPEEDHIKEKEPRWMIDMKYEDQHLGGYRRIYPVPVESEGGVGKSLGQAGVKTEGETLAGGGGEGQREETLTEMYEKYLNICSTVYWETHTYRKRAEYGRNRREYLRQKQLDSDLINHRISSKKYWEEIQGCATKYKATALFLEPPPGEHYEPVVNSKQAARIIAWEEQVRCVELSKRYELIRKTGIRQMLHDLFIHRPCGAGRREEGGKEGRLEVIEEKEETTAYSPLDVCRLWSQLPRDQRLGHLGGPPLCSGITLRGNVVLKRPGAEQYQRSSERVSPRTPPTSPLPFNSRPPPLLYCQYINFFYPGGVDLHNPDDSDYYPSALPQFRSTAQQVIPIDSYKFARRITRTSADCYSRRFVTVNGSAPILESIGEDPSKQELEKQFKNVRIQPSRKTGQCRCRNSGWQTAGDAGAREISACISILNSSQRIQSAVAAAAEWNKTYNQSNNCGRQSVLYTS